MAASNGNTKGQNAKSKKTSQNQPKSKKSNGKSKQKSFLNLRNATLLICLLGICVCILALYIEITKERNPDYVALCDINSYMSCSKVLTSRYSKGFGLVEKILSKDSILNQPNPVYGIAFYLTQAALALKLSSQTAIVQLALSILANIGTVYLAYILVYILQDICLVCISTYIVNFLLLMVNFFSLKSAVRNQVMVQSKKKK